MDMNQPDPGVTGAWMPGDPVGRRQFARLFTGDPLALETGARLGPIDVAYETWGALTPARDNAVLVLHALTGDSHAAGPPEPGHISTGWWDDIIGPGRAIDTRRWFVVCPNILGGCQGTTGPASAAPDGRPYGSRFPTITVRDQVAVEIALAEHLAIERWAAVAGGSMGGMRAIEWSVARPDQVARAIIVAVGAAATAEQIALSSVQNQVIALDPGFAGGDYYDAPAGGGPWRGLALARRWARSATAPKRSSPNASAGIRKPTNSRSRAAGTRSRATSSTTAGISAGASMRTRTSCCRAP